MSMSIQADLTSASLSQTQSQSRPPPPPGGGSGEGPPSHAQAIENLGSSLSTEIRDSLFSTVEEMEEAGASFDEIKSFVDTELEANGIDMSGGQSRSGQLVNIMS